MADLCTDNRFELIEKYKKKLIEETNIESAPDEMKVLDNILFRFWQMDWLDKLEQPSAQQWIPCSERLPEDGTEVFIYLFNNPKSPYIAWIEDSYWYTEEFEVDREHEPLAWMPLPDPWKGEQL